jgi:virginiamycin B lyase
MDFRIGRRPFLAGAGAMIVALRSSAEVALAQEAFCGEVTTFPVPSGDAPHDAVPSPDGTSAWYTAQAQGALGILTVSDGKVTKVPLGDGSAPHGVIAGPDGAAWITDGGRDEIIRVDAVTLKVTRFPTGLTDASLNTAAFDKAGALWFTGQNGYVGRLDPNSGAMSTTQSPKGRGPYGICATPAGNVWYSSLAGTYLGHVTFANDAISIEFQSLPPPARATGVFGPIRRADSGPANGMLDKLVSTTRSRSLGRSGNSRATNRKRMRSSLMTSIACGSPISARTASLFLTSNRQRSRP